MNTGKAFELSVFEALQAGLKKGTLGINAAQAKIHHRKGYWSSDRGKNIIVDVVQRQLKWHTWPLEIADNLVS
jgi:hypothetical protein